MTLEEKAGICSGLDFWNTKAVARLGIPSIMVTDGPRGLRKQDTSADHLGLFASVPATCFPSGAGLACSWDRALIQNVGVALGEECQAENVSVLLGPAANIKRSPLCGRNFGYFSEDPYLSSEIAANHIKGVQSQGVGTSLKHFAVNNQEERRMSVDAIVDERTLREIYLASFEGAVKQAQPWTVMCSYNKVNGEYCSENDYLLNSILKEEWGFEGFVVSDWGAVNERAKGLATGLELEMPASNGVGDKKIVEAVRAGELSEEVLDGAVERVLNIVFVGLPERYESEGYDRAHMSIPENHIKLIEAVAEVQKNIIVVLSNGSPVEMPWINKVKAVLEGYLGGQALGGAIADILFGESNPCGKLAETFPKELKHNPSSLNFPGEGDKVEYKEGIFVGYRYYDAKNIEPLFPFGYGLSYTNFEYTGISVDKKELSDEESVIVSVKVKNTGKIAGKEIVQLYVKDVVSTVIRPEKELKGFEKIELQPGEEIVKELMAYLTEEGGLMSASFNTPFQCHVWIWALRAWSSGANFFYNKTQ